MALLLTVPLYFAAMLYLLYSKLTADEVRNFEQTRLQIAANYATDAATAEMLGAGHLQMDREDENKEVVDPQLALDVFCDVFAVNYGMPANGESRALIQGKYLPVFAVAAYDGVYVARPYEKGSALLAFTPKIPYTYVSSSGDFYALNFSIGRCVTFRDGKLAVFNSPLGKDETLRVINTAISSRMTAAIGKSGSARTVYIPQEMTELQKTNEVKTISAIAFVDNVDLASAGRLTGFSIGGARVKEARRIVGYVRGSTKFYCYADLLPADESAVGIEVFNTPEEAAKAGYQCDTQFML
jgi:hypothetical protein